MSIANINFFRDYGFDHQAEANRFRHLSPQERVQELTQQKESQVNHLLEDKAVSILYHSWLSDNGDLFTSSARRDIHNMKYQIDPAERNGLYYNGLLKAAHIAKIHPNQLVALYSPTGIKLFTDTPQDNIDEGRLGFFREPYTIGQLYLLYFDGEKINNVAVSISNNDNPWFDELSPQFREINMIHDEETRISTHLLSPVLLNDIDDFLEKDWHYKGPIFKNVHGKAYFLDEVIRDMRETFSEKIRPIIKTYDKTVQAMENEIVTSKMISQAYLTTIYRFMKDRNLSYTRFGGGCPGTGAKINDLAELLGWENIVSVEEAVSSFSSAYRDLTQHKEKKWEYHLGHCVMCDAKQENPKKMVGPCNICDECVSVIDQSSIMNA